MPLGQVLTMLEARFSCQFNYAVETTDNISLLLPPKEWSLRKSINYLERETHLKFTVLSNNFISVEPQDSFVFCGYLKDLHTGEPIVSAMINADSNAAISDVSGYFELKINNGAKQVEIRHLGYKTLTSKPDFFNDRPCAIIYLTEKQNELPEIILTDYLTEGINKRSDGSYQINFSDFGILPGLIETDVLQTVQALPGVQSINETVSDINIRGGTNDQNLLIWDGIKMYQSGHFFGLISMYNPMITPKARLIKNGSSVDYTDGVSGTIEMGTDESVNHEFNGSLGLDMMSVTGFVDIPFGKRSSIQVAVRNGLGNLAETPTYNAYVDRVIQDTEIASEVIDKADPDIEFDFNDISLRWLWDVDKNNRVRLNFIKVRNEMELNENVQLNSLESSRAGSLFQNSLASGVYYERNWNKVFQTMVQVYGTDYKLKAVNNDILENQRFLQENNVSEIGVKLNGIYVLGETLKLMGGYQFTETQITNLEEVDDPFFRLEVAEFIRLHGLYSQASFTSKNLDSNFSAGVRANYLEKFNKYLIEPRVSFSQKFLNHFTVAVLGEFKHQVTSQVINFQNDFLGIEKRRWQLSNDSDVPIIKGKQASLGLHWNKNGWLISTEGFYKQVSGITSQSQGFLNQYEFLKAIGSYDAYGLDLLVRKKWNEFTSWLSYSYMENHYTFDSLSVNSFPNNLEIYNAITFGSSYSFGNFKVSAGFNWHSGKPTTRPISGQEIIGQTINYGAANGDRLQDYFRVDISSTYHFKLTKGSDAHLGFSVWNLLNKENIISNYYRINDSGVPFEELKYALRITPNFNFRVSF